MTAKQAREREALKQEIRAEQAVEATNGHKAAANKAHHTMRLKRFDEQTNVAVEALTMFKISPKQIAQYKAAREQEKSKIQ
jgi:hypothetical protein